MGKPTGFKEIERKLPKRRDVKLRLLDWNERSGAHCSCALQARHTLN